VELVITAFGETVLHRNLMRFADNLAAPVAALEVVAVRLREAAEKQFDSEGSYASGGWAPLAAGTVAEKARKGLDPRILHATGALEQSLVTKFDPNHVERLSADTLTFGSTVPYGGYHQTGTGRMPKRPPVALTEVDKIALIKEMQIALTGRYGRSFQHLASIPMGGGA
jgi:phage gpG-like protein